jgi:predicted RNA-binding Zn ribbon-like protein
MSWTASARYRVREAPDGLALVQDLLNTRPITRHSPDLLAELGDAQRWLDEAVAGWIGVHGLPVPELVLSAADLRTLRRLRSAFEEALLAAGRDGFEPGATPPPDVAVSLAPDPDGRVRMVPTGKGARWVASAVWSEALLAQQAGTWPRLKLCHNAQCRSAFYDNSRNNSGVWHDVSTCGNSANLRAFRERRRLQITPRESQT